LVSISDSAALAETLRFPRANNPQRNTACAPVLRLCKSLRKSRKLFVLHHSGIRYLRGAELKIYKLMSVYSDCIDMP
jgi:hypothetical protein